MLNQRKACGHPLDNVRHCWECALIEDAEARARGRLLAATQPSTAPVAAVREAVGKYDDVLQPFLAMMRAELHANAGKGDRPGWLTMDRDTAMLEVYHHAAKLAKALRNDNVPLICEHAADVANMALMVVDICGALTLGILPAASMEADPFLQTR